MLYEMCAARPPFGGATSGDVLVAVLDREPPDLAQVSEGVPAELARVVSKALRKDREERYASAEEFGRELKALKKRLESGELTAAEARTAVLPAPEPRGLAGAELPAHAETVTRVAEPRAPEAPAAKRNATPLVVALVAASLLLAVGVWAYTRRAAALNDEPNSRTLRTGPPAVVATGSKTAELTRTLAYYVTVQKYRDGRPFERPFDLDGEILFEKDYRVRLNVRGREDGHLYIVNERPRSEGDAAFNILFPSPTANGGSSRVASGQEVRIPDQSWFSFDKEEGTELVWLVWSDAELPALEALKRYANPTDRGAVLDAESPAVRDFLKSHSAATPEVSKDDARHETVVRARGEVLAHALKLQHH